MPACPACGKANDNKAQRCGACGASLANTTFVAVTPATRRMGHTVLGVAPPFTSSPRSDEPPDDGIAEPFAVVPATLAGLNTPPAGAAQATSSRADSTATTQKAAPDTLAGITATALESSAPSPIDPSQTLRGFTREGQARDGTSVIADPSSTMPSQEAASPPRDLTPFGGRPGATAENVAPTHDKPQAPPEHQNTSPDRTLLGVSPSFSQQGPTAAKRNATLDGLPSVLSKSGAVPGHATLLGVSPLSQEPEQKPPDLKRTILGIAAAPQPHLSPANSTLVMQQADARAPAVSPHQTMLGVAPAPPQAQSPFNTVGPEAFSVTDEANDRHKGTLLGVAMPGIAPLQPGQAKAHASPPPPPLAAVFGSEGDHSKPQALSGRAHAEANTAQRRLAWVFGIGAALMMLVGTGAVYLWWTAAHLSVQVTSNESGAEQLTLSCSNCPDGTVANIEGSSAHFKNSKATIDLKRRLAVGINRLSLSVKRPNRATSETVSVTVPIEFRVTTSLAELASDPPAITVQLESAPKTQFAVDGRTYTVGSEGKLTIPIDVSKSLTGPASTVAPFEQRVAYEIIRDGSPTKGTLVVRTGVTPLEVFTPGTIHITHNATFTVTGRTSTRAKLTANGHSIPVSSDGSFRQEMALSAPGSTRLLVRAQEPQLAPRIIEITLERVTNLKQRADELAQSLPSDFDAAFASASEKPDSMVALPGEVVASENVNALTRIAATAKCKRAPCLFSVRYGGPLSLKVGSRILAIGRGRLTTRTNNPAERDLSIDASLVVETSAK